MLMSQLSHTRVPSNKSVPPLSACVYVCLVVLLYAQALEVIRTLQDNIPLQRASMKLRLTLPAREARRVREKILHNLTIQHEAWDNQELTIVSTRKHGGHSR